MDFALKHQLKHIENVMRMFENGEYPVVLDSSQTGAGKTYTSNIIAKLRQLKLLIIAPIAVHSKHVEVAALMKNEIVSPGGRKKGPITSATLAGKGVHLSHNLLEVHEVIKNEKIDYKYTATYYFRQLVAEGVLIVVDESHFFKNTGTKAFKALNAMAKALQKEPGRSRMIMMSATPVDKPEYAVSVCKILGLMKADDLYKVEPFAPITLTGILELEELAEKLDPKSHFTIPSTASGVRSVPFDMYRQVFKYHFSSEIEKPDIKAKEHIYNIRLLLSKIEQQNLLDAENIYKNSIGYDDRNGTVGAVQITKLTEVMIKIHESKLRAVADLISERAKEFPNKKFVVVMQFIKHMHTLAGYLKNLNPIQYSGVLPANKRDQAIKLFQAENLNSRLIIIQQTSGGIGIDLDDQNGNFPREMIIFPTYFFIALVQSLGRCYRSNTKSDLNVFFAYGDVGIEHRIMEALAKKASVVDDMSAISGKALRITTNPPVPITSV